MKEKEKRLTRAEYLRLSGAGLLAGIAVLSMGAGCSDNDTAKKACADCPARKNYDKDPASLTGRLWKWHIGFCPGWKGYISSLPEDERKAVLEKYK